MENKRKILDLIINKQAAPLSSALMFYKNFNDLKKSKGEISDKEAHAKANCEVGQFYDIPTAGLIDYGREGWDLLRKNTWDKGTMTFEETIDDSKRDLDADLYGLRRGLLHPFSNCDDILDKNWLNNLNK